jgi:hypothetical protein
MKRAVFPISLALAWAPALAASQFDGLYTGHRTVVRGEQPACPESGPSTWRIANGQYSYRGHLTSIVPVEVSGDGTLKGQTTYNVARGTHAFVEVKGTIANGTLEADAEWHSCQIHYSLKKMR